MKRARVTIALALALALAMVVATVLANMARPVAIRVEDTAPFGQTVQEAAERGFLDWSDAGCQARDGGPAY